MLASVLGCDGGLAYRWGRNVSSTSDQPEALRSSAVLRPHLRQALPWEGALSALPEALRCGLPALNMPPPMLGVLHPLRSGLQVDLPPHGALTLLVECSVPCLMMLKCHGKPASIDAHTLDEPRVHEPFSDRLRWCLQGSCQLPCGAPCDKMPCNERCKKLLKCGHRCPVVCGEPCPGQEFCIVCGKSDKMVNPI